MTGRPTLISEDRLRVLDDYAARALTNGTPGDFAEVGVYQGGSLDRLARAVANRRPLWGFDTFEGMPATSDPRDGHRAGDFADTSFVALQAYFSPQENVRLVQGRFPESAQRVAAERQFAFVHVDCDLYASVRDCCEFFYPRLARGGGVMLFDDYAFPMCQGARAAVDEFVARERPPVARLLGEELQYLILR